MSAKTILEAAEIGTKGLIVDYDTLINELRDFFAHRTMIVGETRRPQIYLKMFLEQFQLSVKDMADKLKAPYILGGKSFEELIREGESWCLPPTPPIDLGKPWDDNAFGVLAEKVLCDGCGREIDPRKPLDLCFRCRNELDGHKDY
jgi:hypothetical protein